MIKTKRIELGLTQTQLSNITGIPLRTIQNWECGHRKCPDYVEKMVLNMLDDKFGKPDYQAILEDHLDMMQRDLKYVQTDECKAYINNIIMSIEESIK